MKQLLAPGKYVIAVSGGVDSVALLNMLVGTKGVDLIVAHYDHGIRSNSSRDRYFAQWLAESYGLAFECEEGKLGPDTSEAFAREKRYEFLRRIKDKRGAKAIVTAHHEDDVLETIVLNMLRGTSRKGLSSLDSRDDVLRPLLHMSKQEILDYALKNNLVWYEDETNSDERYLRNWVRRNIVPRLSHDKRKSLLDSYNKSRQDNKIIDGLLDEFIDSGGRTLNKYQLVMLPHEVGLDLVAHWLRKNDVEIDRKMVERVLISAKTSWPGVRIDLNSGRYVLVQKKTVDLH